MTTYFLLLFYLRYNQSLLSFFSFISFLNYYVNGISFFNYYKIVISIVYLTLKGFDVNIALFHWVYFTSFFNHYIEQNI